MRRGLAVEDAAADAVVSSAPEKEGIAGCDAGLTCSSQDNIKNSSSQIMKASARNSKKRFTFSTRTTVKCCSIASHLACHSKVQCFLDHWQASQPGSSIAQNLTSVAGVAFICACAEAAAASNALMLEDGAPDEETALCEPACTVDFSTCVALDVRR
jgi:hypothetical protein